MPFFPKLVGGVTVRERPRRYEGEPKYRRLDFVRPKEPGDEDLDSWPIIRSSHSVRGIQLYQPAYYSPFDSVYAHRFHPSQAQQYAAAQAGVHWTHPAVQGRYHPSHPIHRIPAPPLSNGFKPKAIEPRRDIDSDDEIIEIIDAGKQKGRGKGKYKGKKKAVAKGHRIFEDDSDSESEYELVRTKKKAHRHR